MLCIGGQQPKLEFVFKPMIVYADVLARINDGPTAFPYEPRR